MNKNEFTLLSEREEQVLLLSTKGLTDKEIARKLNLSIATVNTYWVRIRNKLGGANRAELVASALHKNAEETLTARELENRKLISEVVRRAEAEVALRESQSRMQAVIDGSPVIVFIKDIQGRYTLVNKEFESLINKQRREILGRRDYDIFSHELAEEFRAQDHTVVETGKSLEVESEVPTEGGSRFFLVSKFPLYDTEGVLYSVCGFAREITNRIEFEQALQTSEKRLRSLIESGNDVITLLDSRGTVLYASPSIGRLLGLPPEKIKGTNAFRYIHRDDLTAIRRDFEKLVSRPGTEVDAVYRLKDANGLTRTVEGHGSNLLDDPTVGAIVLNYRDISERVQHERRVAAQWAVAKALAEAPDLSSAFLQVAQSLCEILSFDYAGIWVVDRETDILKFATAWFDQEEGCSEFYEASKDQSFKGAEGFPGRVRSERAPTWITDYSTKTFSRAGASLKCGLKSAIGLPIQAGNETLGVLEFFSRKVVPEEEDFLKVLEVIGHQMGQFLKRNLAESQELFLAKELANANTEVNESTAAAEQERKRYRDLFEEAPDGYVVTDLKGKIQEANQAALDLLGCDQEEYVGKSLKDYIVQDFRNNFVAGLSNLAELGTIHEWELKIRPKDKPVFDASVSVRTVLGANDQPTAHRWLIRDISGRKFVEHELKAANEALERRVRTRTIELEEANLRLQEEIGERKRAEDDLLSSHQFVHNVIESSVDGIMGFDKQCRIILWNRSMEEMSGVNREDVLGQRAFDPFPFFEEDGEAENFKKALSGETVVSRGKAFCVEKTGRSGFIDVHYSPLRNERNEIVGGLGVVRLVTPVSHAKLR